MLIGIGEDGQKLSWQKDWELTQECVHCGEKAHLIFAMQEGYDTVPIEDARKWMNTIDENAVHIKMCDCRPREEGEMWLHDASAIAVYLCPKCLKATALINQA